MRKISRYIEGSLNQEELEVMTEDLMQAKYDRDRRMRWGQLLSKEQNLRRDFEPVKKKKNVWVVRIMIAAASVCLMFFIPGLLSRDTQSANQLVNSYIDDSFFENQGVSKGSQERGELNTLAIEAYNRKDFNEAIAYYVQLTNAQEALPEQYFFLGLSHLFNGAYGDAINQLVHPPLIQDDGQFRQETHWYLGLAYLKNEQQAKGIEWLSTIKPDEWHYEDAQQLISAFE